ncbi:MAG: hypothetical protein ACYDHY_09735 [Acidiferrobacterales bacterium]
MAKNTESSTRSADKDYGLLSDLVNQAINAGDERSLEQAISCLLAENRQDAADLVDGWARYAATSLSVGIRGPKRMKPAEVRLFLIPLLIRPRPGATIPPYLPDSMGGKPVLDSATRSFRQHGLIARHENLALSPGLYVLNDLPNSLSRWRLWVRQFAQVLAGDDPKPIACDNGAIRDDTPLVLRFLAFAVTSEHSNPNPGLLIANSLLDVDRPNSGARRMLDHWFDAFSAILESAFPSAIEEWVGVPGPPDQAIPTGLWLWKSRGLREVIEEIVSGGNPSAARAYCTAHRTDPGLEIRVGIRYPGGRLAAATWPCDEPLETEIGLLTDCLAEAGIEHVTVDPVERSDARCSDCGRPLFPGPSDLISFGDENRRKHTTPPLH